MDKGPLCSPESGKNKIRGRRIPSCFRAFLEWACFCYFDYLRLKAFSAEAAFQGASLHFSNEHVFATFKMQSHENMVIRENEFSVEGAFQSDSLHFSNKPVFAILSGLKVTETGSFDEKNFPWQARSKLLLCISWMSLFLFLLSKIHAHGGSNFQTS